MSGHMRKRGANSWQLIVFNGFDSRGRRQYSRKTVHGTKKEAELLLAVYVLEVGHRSANIVAEAATLTQVLDGWLEFRAPQLSPATVDRYRIAINHVRPALGKMAVVRLETHHLDDFYAKLHREGMSGASVRKIHWAMRQSVVWAKRRGYVTHLATEGVELPPLGATRIQPPTSEVVSRLLDSALASDAEFGTIFAFVAWTGCRRGEVCGLQWRDIDFERSELLFDRSVVVARGGRLEKTTKTNESRRIAIGPATIALLVEHALRRRTIAEQCGAAISDRGFVFSPDPLMADPWHPTTISHRFASACKEAGIPHMRLHDLRHHSATALLKSGVSVGEVMDRHGWKTMDMVSRYRHMMEAKDHGAAETLERLASSQSARTSTGGLDQSRDIR